MFYGKKIIEKKNDRQENAVKLDNIVYHIYIISILDIWTERLRKHQHNN